MAGDNRVFPRSDRLQPRGNKYAKVGGGTRLLGLEIEQNQGPLAPAVTSAFAYRVLQLSLD